MGKFIFGFCTGCLTTLCVVPVLLILVFAIAGSTSTGVSANIDKSTGTYNETKPYDMSQAESNYIGNRAIEEGYNETEAKQIRDAVHKFNTVQQ